MRMQAITYLALVKARVFLLCVCTAGCSPAFAAADPTKAFCLDFNWGEGGPNGFAKPGLWADADPARHVAWYRSLGANVIQTFCVSCNGYAWYKNGVVPEQPGLKHDFLREVVKGAHAEGMLVLGYFCAGSNTRWGREHPELSYGIPSEPHIPYTDEYIAYLDAAIRDAVGKTGIDGFMVDWLRMPTTRASNDGLWLDCEKKLYVQLMGEPFPGEKELPDAKMTEYGRRAVDRAWGVIRKAAKETNPNCLVWLTCCDVNDPHIVNSRALRETDWLLNEAGDLKRTADAKRMIGPHTRLITCLANWNAQDPMKIVPAALKEGIGLYGFTKPGTDSLLPLESLLSRPVTELKGDEKNMAVLARAFHGASLNSVIASDGRFVSGPDVVQTLPHSAAKLLARPSPQQYAWHEQERIQFVCLDPCTWQGREYDNHSTPLSAINPAATRHRPMVPGREAVGREGNPVCCQAHRRVLLVADRHDEIRHQRHRVERRPGRRAGGVVRLLPQARPRRLASMFIPATTRGARRWAAAGAPKTRPSRRPTTRSSASS